MEAVVTVTAACLLLLAAWGLYVPAARAMAKLTEKQSELARRELFFFRLESLMGKLCIPPWYSPEDPALQGLDAPGRGLVFPPFMHPEGLRLRVWKDESGLMCQEGDSSWKLPGYTGNYRLECDSRGLPLALKLEAGPETRTLVLGGRGR